MPKRIEDQLSALRVATSRLDTFANKLPAMVGYWNRDLRCEFANNAYLEWFGLAPQDVIGKLMVDLLGKDLFSLNEPHARLALEGHEQRFERQIKKADGSTGYTDARYVPDPDEQGEVRGFFVLVSDITELHHAHSRVRELAQRLESAREDERKGVSRILHERIAQDLFAIKLWFNQLAGESKIDLANSEIDQAVASAIDNSIEIARNLAYDLRPDMIAHLPLTAGLNEYARKYSRSSGLQIRVIEKTPKPKLDEETRLVFFRAAQELLTNVTRHAKASNVEISLRSDNSTCLVMEVSDDGIGIDLASRSKRGSLGLLGIEERTKALGGSFEITRSDGIGTTVSISIPLKRTLT